MMQATIVGTKADRFIVSKTKYKNRSFPKMSDPPKKLLLLKEKKMSKYLNLGRDSNVSSYDCGGDYIDVTFGDGSTYRYSYASAGIDNVENMKRLAHHGEGLNSYIMRTCKYEYESKCRYSSFENSFYEPDYNYLDEPDYYHSDEPDYNYFDDDDF